MPVILTVAGVFCCKILEYNQTPLGRACPLRAGLYARRSRRRRRGHLVTISHAPHAAAEAALAGARQDAPAQLPPLRFAPVPCSWFPAKRLSGSLVTGDNQEERYRRKLRYHRENNKRGQLTVFDSDLRGAS